MEGYKKCERWKVKAGVTVKKQARKSARVWSKAKPKANVNVNAKAKNLKRREGSTVEKMMKGEINCRGVPLFFGLTFCVTFQKALSNVKKTK